jgi:stage II sporulation protein M
VLFGFLYSESVLSLVKAALEHVRDLAEKAKTEGDGLHAAQLIFWNNLRACIAMLVLGSFYGVFTVFSLFINGLMIGVVLTMASGQTSVSLFDMVLYGLVPHGIFELPAILIASALGLKLGRVLLVPLKGKTRWESYKAVWREVWQIAWFLLLLLVVASGVEGLITPLLLDTFAK